MPGWTQQVGTLLGAGSLSVIVVKVIEQFFKRDDRIATDRQTITGELRQDIRDLKDDIERLEGRLEHARSENAELRDMNTRLRVENEALRERYHGVLNIVQILIARDQTYRERLGLPPDDINLPDWIYTRVTGPTERHGQLQEPPS